MTLSVYSTHGYTAVNTPEPDLEPGELNTTKKEATTAYPYV